MKVAESQFVAFRHTTEADLDLVLKVETQAAVEGFVSRWSRTEHLKALDDPNRAHLMLETAADSQPVGFLLLAGLSSVHDCIEFQRIVVEPRGKGYGRHSLRLLKRYVFDVLGTHRLWLDVKAFNSVARSLYRSEGFVEEGTLRECIRKGGGYESLVVMSLLENEFRSQAAELSTT